MDRPIDPSVTRQQTRKRLAFGGTALSMAVVAYLGLPALLSPGVERDRIRTAIVEPGAVDAAISATGLVVPAIELVIASPIEARVRRVLERPGARLSAGQPIVELDVSQAKLAVEQLAQDLAIRANEQGRTRLGLQKSLIDFEGRTEIKRLQLAQLESQLARDRQLFGEGLLSEELLRKSELATAQAGIELKQIEAERENAREATAAELRGLDLEMAKLRREAEEARRQLALAAARTERAGVLTWVVGEEGATVPRGAPLARVADFSSFRVDASVSDVHAKRLTPGQPALVEAGEETLQGTVSRIDPTVVNGVMTVAIALDNPSNALLRSNLRVDVQIVIARKAHALRIRRGPFATGEGTQDVFVVRGDRAVRTPVTFGLSSVDYFEVVSGLIADDEVIISDMRDYQRLSEVRLR